MHKILFCKTRSEGFADLTNKVLSNLAANGPNVLTETYDSGKLQKMLDSGRLKHELIFIPAGNLTSEGFLMAQKIKKVRPDARIVLIALEESCVFEGYRLGAFRCIPGKNLQNRELLIKSICAICAELEEQNLTFRFLEGKKTFSPQRLIYVESRLHKLHFFIDENEIREYVLYEKLDNIENLLPAGYFVRVHQSFLVNLNYTGCVGRTYLFLKNGLRIDISRARRDLVSEKYAAYLEYNPKM